MTQVPGQENPIEALADFILSNYRRVLETLRNEPKTPELSLNPSGLRESSDEEKTDFTTCSSLSAPR